MRVAPLLVAIVGAASLNAQTPINIGLKIDDFCTGIDQLTDKLNAKNIGPSISGTLCIADKDNALTFNALENILSMRMNKITASSLLSKTTHKFYPLKANNVINNMMFFPEDATKLTFKRTNQNSISLFYIKRYHELATNFKFDPAKIYHPCPETQALGPRRGNVFLSPFQTYSYAYMKMFVKDVKNIKKGFLVDELKTYKAHLKEYYKYKNDNDPFIVVVNIEFGSKEEQTTITSIKASVMNATDSTWFDFIDKEDNIRLWDNLNWDNSRNEWTESFWFDSNKRIITYEKMDKRETVLDIGPFSNDRFKVVKLDSYVKFNEKLPEINSILTKTKNEFESKGTLENEIQDAIKSYFADYISK